MDPITLGTAVVSVIAPFTPYLMKLASLTADSLTKKIADEGGKKTWELAQSIWEYVKNKLNSHGEAEDATRLLARKPDDQNRQTMLVEVIAAQLLDNPRAADELISILGGKESIQKIVATNESLVENVTQQMTGTGQQVVEASDKSTIRGVKQIQND